MLKGSSILEASVGFRSWSRSSAVRMQVTEAINPAMGFHYFPRLPPQPPNITVHWLVPNYTAWWQRHVCINILSRLHSAVRRPGFEPRPVDRKSGSLAIWPPRHWDSWWQVEIFYRNYNRETDKTVCVGMLRIEIWIFREQPQKYASHLPFSISPGSVETQLRSGGKWKLVFLMNTFAKN